MAKSEWKTYGQSVVIECGQLVATEIGQLVATEQCQHIDFSSNSSPIKKRNDIYNDVKLNTVIIFVLDRKLKLLIQNSLLAPSKSICGPVPITPRGGVYHVLETPAGQKHNFVQKIIKMICYVYKKIWNRKGNRVKIHFQIYIKTKNIKWR